MVWEGADTDPGAGDADELLAAAEAAKRAGGDRFAVADSLVLD